MNQTIMGPADETPIYAKLIACLVYDEATGNGDDPLEVILSDGAVAQLASDTGLSPDQVDDAIDSLIDAGVLLERRQSVSDPPFNPVRVLVWSFGQ